MAFDGPAFELPRLRVSFGFEVTYAFLFAMIFTTNALCPSPIES